MSSQNRKEEGWLKSLVAGFSAQSRQQLDIAEKPQSAPPTAAEIEEWVIARLAILLGTPAAEIDPSLDFAHYGMDSQNALRLSGELEEWLGHDLPPTLVWDYPTLTQLACHLATELRNPSQADAQAGALAGAD